MANTERRQYRIVDDAFGIGKRLYRIFLISILFGVLWAKGYLWTIFIIALLLYLYDTFILAALVVQADDAPASERVPEPEEEEHLPRRSPRQGRPRWKWRPEEAP